MLNDEAIIQLYFDRIETAIAETEIKFGRLCRSIAFGILKNHQDAEECESDTYLKAWNTMPPTHPDVLSAFLGRITRNLSLDRYAYLHAEKRGGGEIPLLLDELAECIPDQNNLEQLTDSALADVLNRYLDSLPADARKIFVRRYWFGDSVAEISGKYGFSASKIKMRLMRTRNGLKKELQKEGIQV